MEWIAQNWWQASLVVAAFLALRELAAIRRSAEALEGMVGGLPDVRVQIERGRARREEFGLSPQPEKR